MNIIFVMFVRPSAWDKSTPTGRNFVEFDIWVFFFFRKSAEKIQVTLKSSNNNRYFTWKPIYISDHISLRYSHNKKCFMQKL